MDLADVSEEVLLQVLLHRHVHRVLWATSNNHVCSILKCFFFFLWSHLYTRG